MWVALALRGAIEICDADGYVVGYRIPPSTKKQSIQARSSWQRSSHEQRLASFWERQEAVSLLPVVWRQFCNWFKGLIKQHLRPFKDYNRRLNPQQYKRFTHDIFRRRFRIMS